MTAAAKRIRQLLDSKTFSCDAEKRAEQVERIIDKEIEPLIAILRSARQPGSCGSSCWADRRSTVDRIDAALTRIGGAT